VRPIGTFPTKPIGMEIDGSPEEEEIMAVRKEVTTGGF